MTRLHDERTASEVLEDWKTILRQNRHVTGPPMLAAVLVGLGLAAHQWSAAWWTFIGLWGYTMWAGVLSVPGLPTRSAVRKTTDEDGRFMRAHLWVSRHVEQMYAAAGWVSGGGWSLAVAIDGWSVPMAVVGLVLLVPLWVAWFHHRRIRLAVVVEQSVEAWGDGARVGLPGTRARAVAAGIGWFRIRVTVAGEGRLHTRDEYKAALTRVAALFRLDRSRVTMNPTGDETTVEYVIRTEERQQSTRDLDLTMDRIVGRKRKGTTDDGEEVHTAYVLDGRDGIGAGGQHGVSVGVTGSGKSGGANLDAAAAARAVDCGLIVWDFSYGAAELRAWAPCAWWFCTTPDEALASLEWLKAYAQMRGRTMRGRFHRPTKTKPGAVIVGDELASMFAPSLLEGQTPTGNVLIDQATAAANVQGRIEVWTEFLRLARKYAFAVRGYTQYGVDAALGGETAKQQLGVNRAVYRCNRDQDAAVLVPLQLARTSLFPMDKPGTCHIIGPTVGGEGKRIRDDYLDDDTIAAMVAAWKDHQPQPDPEMRNHPLWAGRPTAPPAREDGDDLDEEGDDLDEAPAAPPEDADDPFGYRDLDEAPTDAPPPPDPVVVAMEPQDAPPEGPEPRRARMGSTPEALTAVWGALQAQQGRDRVSSGKVAGALPYSQRHVRGLLATLVEQGRAERHGDGPSTRYRAVPMEQWPVLAGV